VIDLDSELHMWWAIFLSPAGGACTVSVSSSSVSGELRARNTRSSEFDKRQIEQAVCSRFEEQVRKYPERSALKTHRIALTFEELNQTANRIARAIVERCGARSQHVAVFASDDAHIIAAIIGILKAGKVFILLDRRHPHTRNCQLLNHAEATLVITDAESSENAPRLCGNEEPLIIQSIPPRISVENLELAISPDAPACIVYTSGSTGEPKGVLINQRTLLVWGLVFGHGTENTPSDRVCSVAAHATSHFALSTLRTLLNGASACPFQFREEGPKRLAAWLHDEQITVYTSTPSIFRTFVQTLSNERFPSLRLLRLGGERVSVQDFELFKRYFAPPCKFVNGIGATEVGPFRECFVTHDAIVNEKVMPAGYPLWGKELLLLDDEGREVETGRVGEIAIRSHYLATCYWRQPDLTRAAFSPDPAGSGARIYRTGDLGRLTDDSCLYCLGRKDRQAKIHGNRVELGEVEATLRTVDGVRDAVVTARQNGRGEPVLVGYVVPVTIPGPSTLALRRALQKLLPEYMVPSVFVALDSLPVGSHGKVDYQALPAPNMDRIYAPPRDAGEEFLCKLWQEILGVERVGIQDDFMEIGGDSLSAARLMTEIELQFGQRIPISALLDTRTVEELAGMIRLHSVDKTISPLQQLQVGDDSKTPFFFLHGQYDGLGLYCQTLASLLDQDQPFYVLHPLPPNNDLPLTVESMAKRYLDFLRDVRPHGPYVLGGHCNGGMIALEMAQQLRAEGEDVQLVVVIETAGRRRYRTLRKAFHLAARTLKLSERRELECFVWLRRQFMPLRELSGSQKFRFVWRKLRRLPQIMKSLSRRQGWERSKQASPIRPGGSDIGGAWTAERIGTHYSRLLMAYFPRFYPGRLVVFRAIDEKRPTDDPALGWRKLASVVQVHEVPGDHNSCLSGVENLRVFAERLKSCLDSKSNVEHA
jgi:amino acid adenylation domain-containing protein